MTTEGYEPVRVSRRIPAPAHAIFRILADPRRHLDLDGSGMLRGAVTDRPVTGVGDVFVMRMYFAAHGDYQMNNHVVEYEPDRRIGWEPEAGHGHSDEDDADDARWGHRWTYELIPDGPDATVVTEVYDCASVPEGERIGMQDGRVWIASMEATLARLEKLATSAR